MRKKEFGAITALTTIITVIFMMVCIWNTDFPLMEKGLYTICYLFIPLLAVITISLLSLVRKGVQSIPVWLVGIAAFGFIAIILITFISAYNAQWELRYKALFWLGELMLMYCGLGISLLLSKEEPPANQNKNLDF